MEKANEIMGGFNSIWEILNHQQTQSLDPELFISSLLDLLSDPQRNPVILGGGAGILHITGTVATPTLITLAAGYLESAQADPAAGVGFLRGVLSTCREVAWSVPELLQAIQARLEQWDPDEFLRVLPELRLAFADLTPRETDRVAAVIANLQGGVDLGNLMIPQISPVDLELGLRIDQLMLASLQQDQLPWIQFQEPDAIASE